MEYGATPILKDGVVIGSVVSFTDITERKEAEERIERLLQQFERRRADPVARARVHPRKPGRREPVTASTSVDDLLKCGPVEHFPGTPAGWPSVWAKRRSRRIRDRRCRPRTPVATSMWVHKRPWTAADFPWKSRLGHVINDARGKPADMFGVTQDITDSSGWKRNWSAAKEKAEEATQMKSDVPGQHEPRDPHADERHHRPVAPGAQDAAHAQAARLRRQDPQRRHSLLAVINDILDFSKIEAGKLDIETTDFRLDEVISSVTTLTAQKAHDKGLEFLAHVAPEIPEHLLGDPLRLGQILTNLVNNAVKFTERGEIRLEHRVGRSGPGRRCSSSSRCATPASA